MTAATTDAASAPTTGDQPAATKKSLLERYPQPGSTWPVVYYVSRYVTLLLGLLLCGWRIHNKRRLQRRYSFIQLVNHQSHLDPVYAGGVVRPIMRFMARANLFRGPFGRYIAWLGAYPIQRGEQDNAALKTAVDIVAGGDPLMIFGEGTRGDGGEIQPIKPGTALIARKAKATVLPCAMEGTGATWGPGVSPLHATPATIHILAGEPIGPEAMRRWKAREAAETLRERLQALHDEVSARRNRSGPGVTILTRPAFEAITAFARAILAPLGLVKRKKKRRPAEAVPQSEPAA